MLETDLVKVSLQTNENEQYSRKYNLRFVGLDETEGEDCVDKIASFCKEKLDIDILKFSFSCKLIPWFEFGYHGSRTIWGFRAKAMGTVYLFSID